MCPTSVGNADDITVTSSSQNKDVNINYSNPPIIDPPEGKTAAVIAVLGGQPKDGYYCHCSNKHYKRTLVWFLLDSGSDRDLVFVSKDKSMLLPCSKRLVPQSWNTLIGIFQTKHKARVELNFFDYSDSKRYYSEKHVVEYEKNSKAQYDLILGTETIKELGIMLDFKAKRINIDEIIFPMRNINLLQGTSTLCALKLNNSLGCDFVRMYTATHIC
jgi:hypothetical protein